MNKWRLALATLSVAAIFAANSCKKAVDTSATSQYIGTWNGTTSCGEGLGGWTQRANFPGNGRVGAAYFAINTAESNIVYVAGGSKPLSHDLWSFNPKTNAWNHLANTPGVLHYRANATGFSIDDRGYLVCGADSGFYKNDLWSYDPNTDTWTQKADFPGKPRIKAFSFIADNIAYVGGGVDTGGQELSDFWAYYPKTDSWIQRRDLPRSMVLPFAFNVKKYGYVSCGSQNGTEDTATFCFDSVANSWTRVAGYPGHPRHGGVAFTLNNLAYCGLGNSTNTIPFEDFYFFNPTLNKWNKLGDFPGRFNAMPIAAVANGKGYVGLGGDVDNTYRNYMYEFTPPSNTASFVIAAGDNNYTVKMNYVIGKDTCMHEVTLTGNVSSTIANKEAFSIGTHNVVDKCGKNYSITGSGSLSGDVITITMVTASSGGTSACTFTGKR